jgi:hypothetical protein
LSCYLLAPFSCHSKSLPFKFFLLNFLYDGAQDDFVSEQNAFTSSVIDLSTATSIESLNITSTGGVNLTLSWSDEVTFIGSKGNDRFDVSAGVSVTHR